jgi:hypothetical protein
MKKVFLLVLICSCTNVFAQSAKTRKKASNLPAPPIISRTKLYPDSASLTDEEAIKRILDPFAAARKKVSALIAFNWIINEDTILPADALYKEFIRLNSNEAGRIVRYLTKNSVTVKKNSESKDDNFSTIFSSSVEYIDCAVKVEKNVVLLTDKKNQEVEKFRVFLDKKKEKILKIQNLKNNRIYEPRDVDDTMVPSIGRQIMNPVENESR